VHEWLALSGLQLRQPSIYAEKVTKICVSADLRQVDGRFDSIFTSLVLLISIAHCLNYQLRRDRRNSLYRFSNAQAKSNQFSAALLHFRRIDYDSSFV
jgi:hypothetical protein